MNVKLSDDLDRGDADETVHFVLEGRSYEIDLSVANAAKLRDALKPYTDNGRKTGGGGGTRSSRPRTAPAEKTLYSVLSDDEKGALSELGRHGDSAAHQRREGAELGGAGRP